MEDSLTPYGPQSFYCQAMTQQLIGSPVPILERKQQIFHIKQIHRFSCFLKIAGQAFKELTLIIEKSFYRQPRPISITRLQNMDQAIGHSKSHGSICSLDVDPTQRPRCCYEYIPEDLCLISTTRNQSHAATIKISSNTTFIG